MPDWEQTEATANAAMLRAFGDPTPIVYQATADGVAVGPAVSLTAIRHSRVRGQSGDVANFEEISVAETDLPSYPQRGDWVTAWGTKFEISIVEQPDPGCLIDLTLQVIPQ